MVDCKLEIIIYSHNFSVKCFDTRFQKYVLDFSKKLIHYNVVRVKNQLIKSAVKVFACANDDRLFFRFHINSLNDFYNHLECCYVDKKYLSITKEEKYTPESIKLLVNDKFTPRDYQIPIIDYLIQDTPISKLVTLGTGLGKTKTTLMALSKIGLRAAVVIRAAYTETWEKEIKETYHIEDKDVIIIQGSKELIKLLKSAQDNTLTAKIIILSNVTLANWFRLYEKFKDELFDIGYVCRPHELFKHLRVGVRIIDEVHQHFHGCFKLDCYSHVSSSISLSATIVSSDPFIKKMHSLAYPVKDRYKELELDKYIKSYAVYFNFHKPDYIRTTEYGRNNFSMGAMEKSIMRNQIVHSNYLKLIKTIIDNSYIINKREKKKLVVFAATILMIDSIVKYLRLCYPDYKINRYTAEDPYENIINSDITVTTLGSSGTGLDIPNLTTVILTTMVDSIAANIQSLGRLRKLSDNSITEFYYFVCSDISSSVKYHIRKKRMLQERALSFSEMYTGLYI